MTTSLSPNNYYGKKISRGKVPRDTRILQIPIDFSTDTVFTGSINVNEHIANNTGLPGVQSLKVDNSLNAQSLTIAFDTGDTIVCPAFCQALFPIFFQGELLNFIATTTGAVKCQLAFLNSKEFAQIWSTKIPIAGTLNVSGSTLFVEPSAGTIVDSSGVLAVANTSQQLIAANGNRLRVKIRNPATPASQNIAAPEPVYLNWGAAAVVNGPTSWELLPGETYDTAAGVVETQAINWTAATAGHQLIAKYI